MASVAAASLLIDLPASESDTLIAFRGSALDTLQQQVLPDYLLRHRWYGAKDVGRLTVKIVDTIGFNTGEGAALLTTLRVQPPGGTEQRYFLPLATVLGADADPGDSAVLAR